MKHLFDDPNVDGNIRETPDGGFAVWVPYAHEEPIVIATRELAEIIDKAINEAFMSGVHAAQQD